MPFARIPKVDGVSATPADKLPTVSVRSSTQGTKQDTHGGFPRRVPRPLAPGRQGLALLLPCSQHPAQNLPKGRCSTDAP